MVSLEQGGTRWTYPHFAHDHDSLRYSVRYAMMVDLARETWTWRPNPNAPALPMRQYGSFNPGQGLGGAAVHWSGQLWRYLETDFRYRSHVIERYGKQKIPEGCTAQDWGITYDELEPYYDAFEWDIGASGQAGNIQGRKIPGGNPFESPRSRGFPEPSARGDAARRELRVRMRHSLGSIRSPSRRRSRHRPGPTRTGITAAVACTAASARGSDARSTRRQVPSTRTFRSPSHSKNYEVRAHAKVLRIETGAGRPRDGRHVRRCARPGALPAGRCGGGVGVHAREQQAAPVVTQQGSPRRHRQRPRTRRQELHVPDLSGAGDRALGGQEAEHVHGQHLHDQDHLRLQRRHLRSLRPFVHRRLTALLRAVRARARQLRRRHEGQARTFVGRRVEGRDPGRVGLDTRRSSPRERAFRTSTSSSISIRTTSTNGVSRCSASASTGTRTSATSGGSSRKERSRS